MHIKLETDLNLEITSVIFLSYFNPEISLIISAPCSKAISSNCELYMYQQKLEDLIMF